MKSKYNGASRLALSMSLSGAAIVSALMPSMASAAAADTTDEIVVTGNRRAGGVKAVDSAAPVEVLDRAALARTAQPDLLTALAENFPGFTAQAFGSDTADLTVALALRGVSPNDTLVLVDGKRRHGTANLAVDPGSGVYQGGAAPDLSFIPAASIDHVEVLLDGAAAQYGTDAIAGVVNVILKKNNSGGTLTVSSGEYYKLDGVTPDITGNFGFAPTQNSFLSVTFESKFHDHTDRGAIDPRVYDPSNSSAQGFPGYPNVNHIFGDALYHLNVLSYNSGIDLGDDLEVYSFGSYGHKVGESYENWRVPSKLPTLHPDGFDPSEALYEDDFSFTGGVKGKAFDGWGWDLSTTWGQDHVGLSTVNSGNVQLYEDQGYTPSAADDGHMINMQWTTNFDLTKDYQVGLAKPLTVALGIEERHESYQITAGEPASYYGGGLQSYEGFTPNDAGTHTRDNTAVYIDLATSPIAGWKVDFADRFEHYSDFGDASVYKFTTRYDFSPQYAIRGTISNGFRAPTLAEEYYSSTNVGPTSAFAQLAPDSPGAKLVGVDGLRPELSNNLSFGLVAHPIPKLTATLDFYQISIKDRIVGSGNLYATGFGGTAPAVTAAIIADGVTLDPSVTNTGINVFANGLSTRTQGAEFVVTYPSDFGPYGKVDWSVSGNYNHTVVTRVNEIPEPLDGQSLYNQTAISDVTTTTPEFRINLGGLYTLGKWAVSLHEIIYGPTSEWELGDDDNYYKSRIGTTGITNVNVDYHLFPNVKLTAGAQNLFNKQAPLLNGNLVATQIAAEDNAAVENRPGFTPWGIDGGYYYVKATFTY